MVKQIRHIALILTLLLLGGTGNEAWGKVTYHILTLPFTTYKDDGDPNFSNIRVEALRCTDEVLTVGLPDYFKSPLAENFTYYAANNVRRNGSLESDGGSDTRSRIYQYITTTYDIYEIVDPSAKLREGDAIADNSHVYVTYTYNIATSPIKLDGSEDYNIMLGNRFLCFNKGRNNRCGAILATNVSNENLVSDDFTFVATPGFDGTKNQWFHFRFKYEGNDPYNITIRTAYNGDGTFMETDKALNKTVKKWYKGSSIFCQGKADGSNMLWLASDDDYQYTQTDASGEVTRVSKPGFYRGGTNNQSEMNPIFNSFAILQPDPTQGYIYIGSKINTNGNNWQPNNNGQYLYLTGNISSGRDPKYQLKTPANVEKSTPYPIDTYTYKVTSSLGSVISVDIDMSNYEISENLLSYVPEAIKRKYVTFAGAYKTSDLDGIANNTMTTFQDAADNGNVIWLKYTSSMPFETLPVGGCYDDARWYTIRMNGAQEDQYVAHLDNTSGNFYTGGGSNSDLHQGENSAEAMVAFIGDPFELKIISRKASEDATAAADATAAHNRYIGCASNVLPSASAKFTTIASGYHDTWEIVYENTQMGTMILREMGSVDEPRYIGWAYGTANNPMIYSDESTRIKVVELDKKQYVYHIVRSDGSIAVKASEMQDVGKRLKYGNIPEVIRSPLIDPSKYTASVTFYWSKVDADAEMNPRKNASYDADLPNEGDNVHVYVRYTSGNTLSDDYNVRLNGQYIYHSAGNINSQAAPENNTSFQWYLDVRDPYAMTIKNIGANQYVKVAGAWTNNQSLSWDVEANASLFIVKSSTVDGVYEVMAATGEDGPDAADIYYNIGRPEANTVRMYSNSAYPHGYNQLRFLLTPVNAKATDYHLIDKSNSELLVVRSMRQDLFFPADYRSPLVSTYYYWTTAAHDVTLPDLGSAVEDAGVRQVYVTYDTSNRVNLQKGVMYLLEYETGDSFHQEDGSDGLTQRAVPAVYPYCNGDCNFFVYGDDEYELQQQSAASTRTRWAWYLESTNNDPYHVMVCSRQTETFPAGSGNENRGYFRTYVETFGGSNHVVTSLAWPGITGVYGTEYMVLGSVGQYQLVTTQTIPIDLNGDSDMDDDGENERQVVKSFEQYWKTFDTIRKKIFGDNVSNNDIIVTDPSTVPATPALGPAAAAGLDNRTYLTTSPDATPAGMGFHSYVQWAYAKRWNGFNRDGAKSKGWEEIEHWYQTVNMGEGYFNLIPVTIEPALILIDQHGWEIMRKPLPSDPDDITKEAKFEAIRPYNSPMVKEYYFWGGAKKRSGFHQYYDLSSQIKVNGEIYVSSDLSDLPDYYNEDGSLNSTLFDKKGNLLDQYVTYVAKDEYAQSYAPSTGVGAKFLIQQGDVYASTADGTSIGTNPVADPGGMPQTIVAANGSFTDNYLWYLKPNTDIDSEMGYNGYPHDWTNAYASSTAISGFNSNGFDPYNIQISSAAYTDKYFVTNATGAKIDDGEFVGNSSGTTLSLGGQKTDVIGVGHDSRTMPITNATFMAVQDAKGNMQLMPRFDNTLRVRNFASLVTPVEQVSDPTKLPQTYTKLFLPAVFNYHIIDNSGNESLRYQSGGDLTPHTPEHFKSPLATDFTYYKEVACTNEITESLAGAGKTEATNDVYVRYVYDEHADEDHILKGKWFTMQLNEMDAVYNSGIKYGDSKPATIDGSEKEWQWKLLETPQTEPDPYAVYLYNRSQSEGTEAIEKRFALLWHTSGDYALAEAGTGTYTYKFLNGTDMTTSVAATTAVEANFKSTSGSFTGTGSHVKFIDDVVHTYNYKIYTNALNFAISANQIQAEASQNEFIPILPNAIMTPLLNSDQYLYYEKLADMGNTAKELQNLYGLYEDEVYVRYTAYDELVSGYKVPNEKAKIGSNVARGSGSNDTSLGLGGNLLYNIIWRPDNMMKSNGTTIEKTANQSLQAVEAYEWKLDGNDPYAIVIKDMSDKKVYNSSSNSCTLSDNATTFMLLNKDGHDYGILQVTGDANERKLSGHGNTLTANAATDPTHFVIFALATHKVIYHLVLANIGNKTETIPYREGSVPATPVAWDSSTDTKQFDGTTMRDLTGTTYQLGTTMPLGNQSVNYCYDAGHISLGDKLKVPDVFSRPNVYFSYIVEGVYNDDACTVPIDAMNNKYKGYALEKMGDDTGLLGKTVRINIVYTFDGSLVETNKGEGFVTDVDENKWYTFETKDSEGSPYLIQYTNAWGLEGKLGRGTHYTNDYLWTPVGDPYGFKMYNRYICKTSNRPTEVLMTTAVPANNVTFTVAPETDENEWDIFELLSGGHEGSFLVHPLVNNTGTQYYLKINNDGIVKLNAVGSEWTFGLSEELVRPYYDRAGYIGGLTPAGKTAYETAAATTDPNRRLMALQQVVYGDDANNIVPFTPGYYRLHSPEGIEGFATRRYASGYTHDIERTAGEGSTAIPMHFYEEEGVETYYDVLPKKVSETFGFTVTDATRGELPISPVEYDPASIFYITGTAAAANMSTQGLNVYQNVMTTGAGTNFYLMDIGGGVFLIHDNATPNERMYFCFDQADAAHIYDLKFIHNCHTDHAKWCIQPANKLGLYIKTHSGGDEELYGTSYNYSSFYAPFDILLPDTVYDAKDNTKVTKLYEAFICESKNSPWSPPADLHPKGISLYNIAANGCPSKKEEIEPGVERELFRSNNRFVPAGTPVLIAMLDDAGYVKVTLPNSSPSPALVTDFQADGDATLRDNIFSGVYLEQLLSIAASERVFTFGLPLTGSLTLDPTSGEILATLPSQDNTGLGFYLNANKNKELNGSQGGWDRNNRYVLGNRVYHLASGFPTTLSREYTRGVEYVPVMFNDAEGVVEEGLYDNGREFVGDNCIYDLQGRRVATEQEVLDGTWHDRLAPGIYILNGRKFSKK